MPGATRLEATSASATTRDRPARPPPGPPPAREPGRLPGTGGHSLTFIGAPRRAIGWGRSTGGAMLRLVRPPLLAVTRSFAQGCSSVGSFRTGPARGPRRPIRRIAIARPNRTRTGTEPAGPRPKSAARQVSHSASSRVGEASPGPGLRRYLPGVHYTPTVTPVPHRRGSATVASTHQRNGLEVGSGIDGVGPWY